MARQPAPTAPNAASEEREKSKNISALKTLFPFIAPYRTLLAAARDAGPVHHL